MYLPRYQLSLAGIDGIYWIGSKSPGGYHYDQVVLDQCSVYLCRHLNLIKDGFFY